MGDRGKTDSMAKVTEITTTSAAVMDAVKKGMDFVTNNAKVRKRKVLGKRGLKLPVVITTCP